MPSDAFSIFKQGYADFFRGVLDTTTGLGLKNELYESVQWRGLDWHLRLRQGQGVLEFVPAIRKRRTGGVKYEKSVGVMLDIPTSDDADWMVFESSASSKGTKSGFIEAGAPGFRYETDVLSITVPVTPIITRLRARASAFDARHLAAAAISFDAAFTMAAAAELELELSDFGRTWRLLEDRIQLYYYDVSPGGNGIARAIYQDWTSHRRVAERAANTILNSTCCQEYCDRCILLPRMPESFVRRGLLSKRHAAALVEE